MRLVAFHDVHCFLVYDDDDDGGDDDDVLGYGDSLADSPLQQPATYYSYMCNCSTR